MDQALCPEAAVGAGVQGIRRARRLPRNLGGGWEMACPSLSGDKGNP